MLKLQELCHEFNAVLLLDVAHDLGALGPHGSGQPGLQKMLGKIDLVIGAFSKTFSSNGGFLATHNLSVKQYISIYGGSYTFSNALSPIQTGVVDEALRIARSEEGDRLRNKLFANINRLRSGFAAEGLICLGAPSPIVPVSVGDEKLAKWTSRALEKNGLIANLVEYPAVARGSARFRFQVMASHTFEQIDSAIQIFCRSLEEARSNFNANETPSEAVHNFGANCSAELELKNTTFCRWLNEANIKSKEFSLDDIHRRELFRFAEKTRKISKMTVSCFDDFLPIPHFTKSAGKSERGFIINQNPSSGRRDRQP